MGSLGILRSTRAHREIHPQLPSINHLLLQMLLRPLRSRNINEICMSEASRLARAAVDGDTYIEHITDFAEKI